MNDFLQLSSSNMHAVFLLVAAITLLLAGMSLLSLSFRVRTRGLDRRVNLANPLAAPAAGTADAEAPTDAHPFLHQPSSPLSERNQRETARILAKLHVPAKHASTALLVIRLALVAILGLGFFSLGSLLRIFADRSLLLLLISAMFAICGWFIPVIVIAQMGKSRTKKAANGLPDALELLVICVEAGLALEDGIDRMVIELRHSNPPLAEEFALTSADLKILPNREQALFRLADRIDVPSVRSVVTTLAQSMRYGTPLVQAMRVVASEMRNDSLIAMEERANRLPTLMTLPMMLFIMPTIFLIVGGPAALRIIDTFLH